MNLFALSIFLASAQLFLVQPMFAKKILPILGGTASVWTTCMLFYQLLLLAGYVYAHIVTKRWTLRQQLTIHGALLLTPFFIFAVGPPVWAAPDADHIVQWLLSYLLVAVGLPFFLLSTNAPLVQRWFADTSSEQANKAYFLYSASNLGSLFALIAYPTLIEPALTLGQQYTLLVGLYATFALTMAAIIFKIWNRAGLTPAVTIGVSKTTSDTASDETLDNPIDITIDNPKEKKSGKAANNPSKKEWIQRASWVFLAFIPSSLLLSVTTYITSNIAPCPLFWVVPLALYLLSFVIAFSPWSIINRSLLMHLHALLIVLLATVFFWTKVQFSLQFMFPLHLLTFFVIALLCHIKLADSRPDAMRLTEFYLCVAIGGAIGGTFNALIAPMAFRTIVEYPAVLALSCLARGRFGPATERTNWLYGAIMLALCIASIALIYGYTQNWPLDWLDNRVMVVLTPAAFICLAVSTEPLFMALCLAVILSVGSITWKSDIIFQGRNTFGTLAVVSSKDETHFLSHGNIMHGAEVMSGPRPHDPVAYYHLESPIGHIFSAYASKLKNANVALIGLGAGTMAAYAQPGQSWTFYEINPLILKVARDEKLFTYLADCRASSKVVLGDGRQAIARAKDKEFNLIAFDAFSADSVPVHLITREAIRLYLTKLADGGILVFHIDSRTIDLKPTLRELARDAHLAGLVETTSQNWVWNKDRKLNTTWFVMARCADDLAPLKSFSFVQPDASPKASIWTDDFSNLMETLRLH